MTPLLLLLALPALARPAEIPAELLPQRAELDAVALPAPALPWRLDDPGQLDPRQAGCATRTPGIEPTAPCQVTLVQEYGPHAVVPASVTRPARDR